MENWEIAILAKVIAEHDSVPPPYTLYPKYHPTSGGWRMGNGEEYLAVWENWWLAQNFTLEQKVTYFKSYPLPSPWLKFVLYYLFQDELAESDLFAEFEESGYETEEPIKREELEPYFFKARKIRLWRLR